MTVCPEEAVSQHDHSPGLVLNGETVCRGAYTNHYKGAKVKNSFIQTSYLLAGELTVWRVSRDPNFGIAGAVEELKANAQPEQELRTVFGAMVEHIRNVRDEDRDDPEHHLFCVIDDCATDLVGGWHREHAAIRLATIPGITWTADSDLFLTAREALKTLFCSTALWAQ